MMRFELFANCIPVKGVKRSIICDLQFGKYWFIPNALFDVLINLKRNQENTDSEESHPTYTEEVQSKLELLSKLGLGHWVSSNEPVRFADLNRNWQNSSSITNSIIDITTNSNHNYSKLILELSSLGCKNIQFRFYNVVTMIQLIPILETTKNTRINHVEIILPYSVDFVYENCQKLVENYPRIVSIFVYSSPAVLAMNDCYEKVVYTQLDLAPDQHCGEITPFYFTCNNESYAEGLHFNTCLNRKISINGEGNICNCPSLKTTYGNHHEKSLKEVAEQSDFQKNWTINKGKISICKSCEFRYICTDCRAFVSNPLDEFSKPLKCGYDPIKAEWKDWSTNPLNKEAIDFYEFPRI